jgi:hypothetical protein
MLVTAKSFQTSVEKELEPLLKVVEDGWGFRPNLEFTSVSKLRIRIWRYGNCWWDASRKWFCCDTFFINAETGESCNKRYRQLAVAIYKQLGKKKATDYTVNSYDLSSKGISKPKGYENCRVKYTAEP